MQEKSIFASELFEYLSKHIHPQGYYKTGGNIIHTYKHLVAFLFV